MDTNQKLIDALNSQSPFDDSFISTLHQIGFEDAPKAWVQLLTLRKQTRFPERYPTFFKQFFENLSVCFDPDLALNNFLRLTDTFSDKEHFYSLLTASQHLLEALIMLFSGSQVLSDTLLAKPKHIDWLSRPETLSAPKTQDVLYRDFYTLAGTDTLPENTPALLRQFKKREYIRIGLRDLMGRVTLAENVESLSDLADVCLQVAYEFSLDKLKRAHGVPVFTDEQDQEWESEFAILSMGKLGGRELNYSSDIDLIYIYTSSAGMTRPENPDDSIRSLSNHEFHSKLGQLITKTIHEITAEGSVFRVDLELRPQGNSGEIVNSLSRCETYYQSWGRTWERQAMIKARVSAGSDALGKSFFEMISPFIYRRSLDFSAIEEVKDLKGKIDLDLIQKKKEKGHIKLGQGGIREIEFLVQAYQLLFGGRDKSLRDPNTLRTLSQLQARKFITSEEYERLRGAYVFLRNLENRVQVSFGLQTYHLPTEMKPLEVLARKMGVNGATQEERVDGLMAEFKHHTAFVHTMFTQLFAEKEKQQTAERTLNEWGAERNWKSRFSPELIREFSFPDPEQAFRFLKSLRDGPVGIPPSEKSIRTFYEVLPSILELGSRTPMPNGAVENLVKFLEASRTRDSFLDLFHANEKILKLFLVLFGSGELLSSILIKQPNLMDVLMSPDSLYRFKTPEQMRVELQEGIGNCQSRRNCMMTLRRFKQAEELRIGIRYLIQEVDLPGTLQDLSSLADLYLQTSLQLAADEIREERGDAFVGSGGLAILGLGKLGGEELNFGSDLDLVFVYEDEASVPDAMTLYSNLSQKIYKYCSEVTQAGVAYKVDADLRPEGNQGTLILPLSGYRDYFKSRGRVWEQQAMTRVRFVAGNPEVGDQFMKIAEEFTYSPRLDYGGLIEIARLRERMEVELAREDKKGSNIKLGYGGLADIEFTVQILQLMHGERTRALRETNTLKALAKLPQLGFMDDRKAESMRDSYLFLRNLECSLRLFSERAESVLPKDQRAMAALARMTGFHEGEEGNRASALEEEYTQVIEKVRTFYRETMDKLLRSAK